MDQIQQFRAINKTITENYILPTEEDSRKGFVNWGKKNDYPDFLNSLYKEVSTLHSIIEGTVDFVCGKAITIDDAVMNIAINSQGTTITELVRNLSRDLLKYGGFAFNVVRNKQGGVAGLYFLPFERLRADEKREVIYYSKDWAKSAGRVKFTQHAAWKPGAKDASSIYYYSNTCTDVYPSPKWSAAIKAADIERQVNDYHLNSIANGFSASYFISLNDGKPNEQQADEIEENLTEKYTGSVNGGSLVLSFSDDKDHAPVLTKLETEDAGEKYKSLIERTKSEIFTAFRAQPQIFGINLDTGFNVQDYKGAFDLYNTTAVRPIQQLLVSALARVLGMEITIEPFALED